MRGYKRSEKVHEAPEALASILNDVEEDRKNSEGWHGWIQPSPSQLWQLSADELLVPIEGNPLKRRSSAATFAYAGT
jgi:hypothetical protein